MAIITLSADQINGFMKGTVGVDRTTMGWAMVFVHESFHTSIGGELLDPPNGNFGTSGDVEDKMNIIRQELNAQGGNFGQRMSYEPMEIQGMHYLPFSTSSKNLLIMKKVPISNYISTKK